MNFISEYRNLNFATENIISQTVNMHIKDLKKDKVRVAFCGSFKSGKSSLINALLKVSILPTRTTTATAVITRIFYSKEPLAYVLERKSNGELRKKEIFLDDIATYIVIKEKTLSGVILPKVKEVCIGIPSDILRSGIEIIDTPGLEDDDELTKVTMDEINSTDLAVIVFNASRFISKEEKNITKDINDLLGGNVLFAINRIDQVHEIESLKAAADYYLGNFGNDLVGKKSVVFTSAKEYQLKIEDLEVLLKKVLNEENKTKIAYHSRLNILNELLEISMNDTLNKWEECRAECEEFEKRRKGQLNSLTKSMSIKIMQLCNRINNVRYNINAYLDPFKNTCITIAKNEGLLQNNNFNTYALSHCIEKTNQIFTAQFQNKLEGLCREFNINLNVRFSSKSIVTPGKIDDYLQKTSKFSNSIIGQAAVNIFGQSTFNELERLIKGDNKEKYLLSYLKAVEDEMDILKLQINKAMENLELEAMKKSQSYNPIVNVPIEIKATYSLMKEYDLAVKCYRESISKVNSLL
ncbi:dynamin family protein [Clostridium sp. DL1XJH146]